MTFEGMVAIWQTFILILIPLFGFIVVGFGIYGVKSLKDLADSALEKALKDGGVAHNLIVSKIREQNEELEAKLKNQPKGFFLGEGK